ncbi:hypothetical protein lerEdw1_010051 [Lerista edwardsae]|nr:hypothetical protein lerEdw1_010051 [Lerista edwardsae]
MPCPPALSTTEIGVSVSGTSVFLTCLGAKLSCDKRSGKLYVSQSQPLPLTAENEVQGQYTCRLREDGPHVGHVYLKVKVCESCVELGLGLVAGIILADVLLTLGVLLGVYYCSKNRVARLGGSAAGGGGRGRPRGPKTDAPPPVPNPDYEPIRKGQREVYAGLEPSRAF